MFKKVAEFLGADGDRDKETFFLSASLELGVPPSSVSSGDAGPLYLAKFCALAIDCNIRPADGEQLLGLLNEYRLWYDAHQADV
jgi:hypothetical protein